MSLRPDWHGIRGLTRVGSWLMLRTLSLRIAILATVVVVTAQGPVNLAAHQLAMTIFTFFAFALDALAIAAQALIGKELGAARPLAARALTRTMTRWGIGFGVLTGILLAVAAPWAGALFTSDADVRAALTLALWVLAAGQPLAGCVFVLDGVLIGRATPAIWRSPASSISRPTCRCCWQYGIPAPAPARACSGCGPRSPWATWRRAR